MPAINPGQSSADHIDASSWLEAGELAGACQSWARNRGTYARIPDSLSRFKSRAVTPCSDWPGARSRKAMASSGPKWNRARQFTAAVLRQLARPFSRLKCR